MIKFIRNAIYEIEYYISNVKERLDTIRLKKKYPDYNELYDYDTYHFIYGVTSWDNLTGSSANLHTMNDLEIGYDRETKLYSLSIETAYVWINDRLNGECEYLKGLLKAFDKYMDNNNLSKNEPPCLFMQSANIDDKADSIEELYMKFKMYVLGYCAICEHKGEL